MGGLSYFSDGNSVDSDTEKDTDTSAARVQVKPTAGKGKIQYPTISGTLPAGKSTLEAMEEMYQDMLAKQTGLSGFLEAAKDAQAWWTPGGAQRAQALDLRGKAREAQSAELFNMRSQIAQYKAALEDQAQFQKEKPGLLGQASTVAGIDLQPHEIAMLERMTNRADFNKLLEKFVMERTKGLSQPGAAENKYPVLVRDEEGNFTIPNEVPLAERNRLIRSGEGILPGAQPPAAKPPTTTAPAAGAGDLTPADRAIPPASTVAAAPAPAPGPAVAAAPTPAPAPVAKQPTNYTFDELTPQQLEILRARAEKEGLIRNSFDRPDAAELFNKMPLERRKKLFEALGPDESVQPPKVAAAPAPAAPAPTAPAPAPAAPAPAAPAAPAPAPAAPAARRTQTIPEIRAQQELQRQRAGEQAKTEAESERTHNAAAETAIDRERTASEIINIVTKNREITGVLQEPGIAAALGTLVQTGISAPGGHSIGIKEIDEVLFKGQKNLTRDQIVARDRLRSLLNKTSLNAASIMKGQGAVTEFERQLLQNMVGSLNNTPENLIRIQRVLMENAANRRKIDEMYKRSGKAWGDFVKSDQYINLQNDYNNRLRQLEDEPVTFEGPKKAAAPKQPFSKEEEDAYQKWKQDQIKKRQKG